MNYARKLVSIFLCVLIFVFSLTACGGSGEAADESTNRFYGVDKCFLHDEYIASILVDRETKVCYLYGSSGNRAFMTVLLDADGKPLIWEEE